MATLLPYNFRTVDLLWREKKKRAAYSILSPVRQNTGTSTYIPHSALRIVEYLRRAVKSVKQL